jgi:hypothetical protein
MDVVSLLLGQVVSTKKTHCQRNVVGLLLGEVVSSKYDKKHILAKDVVGLLLGDNEDLLIISQK